MAKQKRDDKGKFAPVHGAWCKHIRKRYSDGRTREGKRLKAVMNGYIEDLGGKENLTSGQWGILANIRANLIVIWQIGDYIDKQMSIVDSSGELIPCVRKGLATFQAEYRRNLEALGLNKGKTNKLTPEEWRKNHI